MGILIIGALVVTIIIIISQEIKSSSEEIGQSLAYNIMIQEVDNNGMEALVHIINRRFKENNKPGRADYRGTELILNIENPELAKYYKLSKMELSPFDRQKNEHINHAKLLIDSLKSISKDQIINQDPIDKHLYQLAGVTHVTSEINGIHLIKLEYPTGREALQRNIFIGH